MNELNILDETLDYLNGTDYSIPVIDYDFLVKLDEAGLTFDDLNDMLVNENVATYAKENIANIVDLKNQWKKIADKFTMHKFIIRYIKDEKQEALLHKHFDNICDEDVKYGSYKKSFNYLCSFFGLPNKGVILEWITFENDKVDKNQKVVKLRYSRGLARVNIPEGMYLLHSTHVGGINKLIPSFKSKSKGKYFYPSNRVFFTVQKNINPYKFGSGKNKYIPVASQKMYKYTPKKPYQTAFIDPSYSMKGEINLRSVYIETDKPIEVIDITNAKTDIFNNLK
jgi:hypothetical protein